MDWGSKTAAGTVTHRFWSAGPPATGDATPDATVTMTGGTPGTANQGTFRLSTGTFDLSGSGKALVPDVVDFTTQGALGARVAEGRYVGSVPASGSTNVRITDIQEDANGNLIATLPDGTTESFAPTSTQIPADANTTTQAKVMIIGDMMFQSFYVANYQNDAEILFPVAFAAGEIPNVVANNSPNPTDSWSSFCNPYQGSVTNTGFKIQQSYLSAAGATGTANGPNVWVMAMGKI